MVPLFRTLLIALTVHEIDTLGVVAHNAVNTGSRIILGTTAIQHQAPDEQGEFKDGAAVLPVEAPEVFPVPTASRCIVIICCQYMIIYTALAICRTYCELAGEATGNVEAGLKAAAQTLTYGPMLCVLFIACRMRVEFLSNGTGQPQQWVQYCMYGVTFAVLASTLLVLLVPLLLGKPLTLKEGTCDLEKLEQPAESEGQGMAIFYAVTSLRYLILLGLYGGLAGIIVGTCTYLPPGEKDLTELPAPAPAVLCTMILSVVFFLVQLVIAFCRTSAEFTGVELPFTTRLMNGCATTVEFAPMLAILFLAARMRALQHDGQPQTWAQHCMYFSTGALCVTALLALVVPVAFRISGSMRTNGTGERTAALKGDAGLFYVLSAVRIVCMMSFYGGALGVIYSIFVFEAPAGASATLPVSPTVQCVVILTCLFFLVFFMQFVLLHIEEATQIPMGSFGVYNGIEAAKATLQFAPMLSILFVTTRMYALLITNKRGAPQAWVQDGMFMATWALLISFVTCLVAGLVMDEKVQTDAEGNVVNTFSNQYVSIAMTTIRYVSMLLLYGGIITVIVGLFVMTPETANGRGSVPVVTDAVNATPVGKPPPTPDQVAKSAGKAGSDVADVAKSLF